MDFVSSHLAVIVLVVAVAIASVRTADLVPARQIRGEQEEAPGAQAQLLARPSEANGS